LLVPEHSLGTAKELITMPASSRKTSPAPRADILPPGTPKWITMDLVRRTVEVWQPHYSEPISIEEAVAILTRMGQLFTVLSEK
jgi:hypothetical protein